LLNFGDKRNQARGLFWSFYISTDSQDCGIGFQPAVASQGLASY
jgi:hypothetical protein